MLVLAAPPAPPVLVVAVTPPAPPALALLDAAPPAPPVLVVVALLLELDVKPPPSPPVLDELTPELLTLLVLVEDVLDVTPLPYRRPPQAASVPPTRKRTGIRAWRVGRT